jgi:hypothetical protein
MVYYYGAAAHCVDCATWADMTAEDATDSEGNPVGVAFECSEDAWSEVCDDCGGLCRVVYGFTN